MKKIKLITFQDLVKIRKKHKSIVLCHGVFDILHTGHINYFKFAKSFSKTLVVSVTDDKYVQKGPSRPVFNTFERSRYLEELSIVDYVIVSNDFTSKIIIENLKPNFYCKDQEYKKQNSNSILFEIEKNACQKNKVRIIFSDKKKFSSTNLINKTSISNIAENFRIFDEKQIKFIKRIKKKYSLEYIVRCIDNIKKNKIIVVGDPIIDQYIFSKNFGTASKSPTIATEYLREESFNGGVLLLANIFQEFGAQVQLLTYGNKNILKKYLNQKISIKNLNSLQKVPTVRRYIDSNQNYKMFQVYLNSNYVSKSEKNLINFIKKKKKEHFVMIDFGFGIFNRNFIKDLKKVDLKIDLNVHSNFLNKANNFDNYRNINYLSLNKFEYEIWFNNLFLQNKKKIRSELKNKAKSTTITLGKDGAIMLANNKFIDCPIFFKEPKDTVGCGDSFFAISSVLLKNLVPNDLTLFLANCYAGIHATKIGNKIVTKEELIISIKSLLG